jgi:hypothetical protein
MRKGIRTVVRVPVAFGIALVLTASQALLMDKLPVAIVDRIPRPLMYVLHLPGAIYCKHLIATERVPIDDVAIFRFGQAIECYFTGLALDVPYYTVLILIGWWLVAKWRGKRTVVAQPT